MVLVDCARAFFPFFFDVALLLGRRFLPILLRRCAATWASVSSHSFSTLGCYLGVGFFPFFFDVATWASGERNRCLAGKAHTKGERREWGGCRRKRISGGAQTVGLVAYPTLVEG